MKQTTDLLPISNGMTEENRKNVIEVLHKELADHYLLVTKTKYYHWNIDGPDFHDLHLFFDDNYETLSEIIDTLAEQCLKLGGQSTGTLAQFMKDTRLKEDDGNSIPDTREMVQNLLQDHEAIITNLHEEIKKIDSDFDDAVTSNMLQDTSDKHQKIAWMLRMILKKDSIDK